MLRTAIMAIVRMAEDDFTARFAENDMDKMSMITDIGAVVAQ